MRRFLLVLFLLMVLTSCRAVVYKVEQTRIILGTRITITVLDPDQIRAKEAINQAFETIKGLEVKFDINDNNSDVGVLSKNKRLLGANQDMLYIMRKSIFYSFVSDGAYDPTVQSINDIYNKADALNKTPTDTEIIEARKTVGFQRIRIENDSIFMHNGTKIGLAGIAKGYVTDNAIQTLKSFGVTRAMINTGGDISAIGTKAKKESWSVKLQNPNNGTQFIASIELSNQSMASYGDYERYYEPSKKVKYVINPKTGRMDSDLISAIVIAPNATDADALAQSVFILGKEKGISLIESFPETSAILVTKERQIIRSSRFKD